MNPYSAGAIPYFWAQFFLFAFGASVAKTLSLLSGQWLCLSSSSSEYKHPRFGAVLGL
jgi:hypothetical protein